MELKSELFLKIDLICRVCLLESNELISLFDEVNYSEENILSILQLLENISLKQMPTDSKYPRMICKYCLKKAMVAFNLKQRMEKSEEILQGYVQKLSKEAGISAAAFYCTVCERKYNRDEQITVNGKCVCRKCNEDNNDESDSQFEPDNETSDESEDDKRAPPSQRKQKYLYRMNENSEKVYYCTVCAKEFKLACNLVQHMRTHTSHTHATNMKEAEHICAVCDQKFASLDELRLHIVVHTKQKLAGRGERSPPRAEAPKPKTSRKRVRHPYTLNAAEQKVYTCPVCSKEYNRSFALSAHMKLHSSEPSHLCYLCGKGFHTSGSLTRHMLTHTEQRPYACQLCPKKYKQLIGLKSHMRGHTGERPYLCSVCGKGFKQNSELKCHTRYHTQEKPYECNVCGKRTAMQSHMKQHMRSHTGEKPYVCRVCAKRFGDSGSLKQHEMAHSGVKPYVCNICNKAFGRPNSLRTHYKVHNKTQLTTS